MVFGTQLTPPSDGHDDETETENPTVSDLFSALRAASRPEDFGRVEQALSAREAKLRREIEKQRYENALLDEKHEFERLEKLRVEEELRLKLSPIKAEAVSEENGGEGREVILELRTQKEELERRISRLEKGGKTLRKKGLSNSIQKRRSDRLAAIGGDTAANNDSGEGSSAPVKGNKVLRISGYRRSIQKQIRRKMGKNKMENLRWGRGEEYVQYRCNMLSFFSTMQRIKGHLTERHLELLRQTPFWPLISAFYSGVISEDQCKKSESDVRDIIKCYNSRTMSFQFGSTSASLTTEDMAEILGLPQEGEELKLKGSRSYKSDFVERYFNAKRVYKTLVDKALDEAIKGKRETDVEDVVRLILIELCITFLLCNSGQVTSWNLVKYCEDLESVSRYSWAKAVADVLHEGLEKRTGRFKPYSVPGCVVAIMLWLCERTNLIQPIKGREGQKPALVKWSMQELHLKLKRVDVADIGLSFKKDKERKKLGENEKAREEAITNGREEREEWENVTGDTVGELEDHLLARKRKMKFVRKPPISKRLNDNEDLEEGSEDIWRVIQNASADQGKVSRLTEKLESKKEKTKKLKRKLNEEKKEKRKLKEENEVLTSEKKSLFDSLKRLVKMLEETLEAEREAVKNLKKEKMELIKENRELKEKLNQGSPCSVVQLREDVQVEVSPMQSFSTSPEKGVMKRVLDFEFEDDRGEKKRKVDEERNGKKGGCPI
ncbi:hypothetical protein ACFX1Z_037923 [Malus domestica]